MVALLMVGQAAARLLEPAPIDFESSLPSAVLGLLVNLASYRMRAWVVPFRVALRR